MKNLSTENLVEVARSLIELYTINHEHLEVKPITMNSGVVLTIKTDSSDAPKVIGSKGANIRALETLFHTLGETYGIILDIDLLDAKPVYGARDRPRGARLEKAKVCEAIVPLAEWVTRNTCTVECKSVESKHIYIIKEHGDKTKGFPLEFQGAVRQLLSMVGNKYRMVIRVDFQS